MCVCVCVYISVCTYLCVHMYACINTSIGVEQKLLIPHKSLPTLLPPSPHPSSLPPPSTHPPPSLYPLLSLPRPTPLPSLSPPTQILGGKLKEYLALSDKIGGDVSLQVSGEGEGPTLLVSEG